MFYTTKKSRKLFYPTVAIFLALLTALTCCLFCFSPEVSNAVTITEEEKIESHLTNSDVTDEEIEVANQEIEEKYEKYLQYDVDGHLYLDVENIATEDYDESIIEMIQANLSIMNELVDENVATITEDNGLEFTDDEFAQQWAIWDYSIRWNKFTAKFDKDVALVFGIICMIYRLYDKNKNLKEMAEWWTKNAYGTKSQSYILYALQQTCTLPAEMLAYFQQNTVLIELANCATTLLSLITKSNPATAILSHIVELILGFFVPSLVSAFGIIYDALRYNKGLEVKLCWIPAWWKGDKWGITIKSI